MMTHLSMSRLPVHRAHVDGGRQPRVRGALRALGLALAERDAEERFELDRRDKGKDREERGLGDLVGLVARGRQWGWS